MDTNTRIQNFGPSLIKQRKHFNYSMDTTINKDNISNKENIGVEEAKFIGFRHIYVTLGLEENDFVVKNAYQSSSNGITHIYLKQIINGIEITNSDININIDRRGRVITMGSTAYIKPTAADNMIEEDSGGQHRTSNNQNILDLGKDNDFSDPRNTYIRDIMASADLRLASVSKAIKILARHLDKNIDLETSGFTDSASTDIHGDIIYAVKGVPTNFTRDGQVVYKPAYIQLDSGKLESVWDLQVKQNTNWWNAFVSTRDGKVVSLINWTTYD
ncbi:hypothetical protein BB561_004728 [Smittium simulii]|uniref:FTP domain-containing protein n=1 Tax=Smittium simulii TaxID=133385 RepID=A0A2T9YEK4_9FUNG|nr:hypothetical protein BB561_004728 [Smittium simulii]